MGLIKFLFSKSFIKHLGLALVVFVALFFVFTKWLSSTTNHDEFREVPNLVGKKIDIAKELLAERDLKLGDIEYKDYDPKYPKEGIVEQSPVSGSKVKEGRKIYLSINKSEYRLVPVPKLKDKTKRDAISLLTAMGFKIGEITYKPHFAEDAVMELKHKGKIVEGGSQLPYTSVIDIVLGDGKLDYGDETKTDENIEGETIEGDTNEGNQ